MLLFQSWLSPLVVVTFPPAVLPAPARSGVAEDAAFVIVVMQFRAIRTFAFTGKKKNLSRCQHAQGWRAEIDPEGVPVSGI